MTTFLDYYNRRIAELSQRLRELREEAKTITDPDALAKNKAHQDAVEKSIRSLEEAYLKWEEKNR